jgi:hypothetical protein
MRPHLLLLACALTLATTHPATAHTTVPATRTTQSIADTTSTGSTTPGAAQATSTGRTTQGTADATLAGRVIEVTGARPSTPGARLASSRADLAHLTKRATARTATLAKRKDIRRTLLLTVARGESPTPADHAVLLQCTPAGGTHPKPADACRLLEPLSADLNELNAAPDTKCEREYDPVTVFAAGLWDTQRLTYEHTYANLCELRASTGAVFNLGTR